MPIPIALIAAAAPSIIKGVSGLLGARAGKRRAERNPFPEEQANPLYAQNLAIAENMAQTGLPQQSYNQAQQNFQRNQSNALRQFSRMGSNARGLAGIVRAGNDATLNLDVADANARMGNQQRAMGYRSQLAGEQNRVFDWNKRKKFMMEAEAASQQISAGKQNAFGALNDLSQLGQIGMMTGAFGGGGQATAQMMDNPLALQRNFSMPQPRAYLNRLDPKGYMNLQSGFQQIPNYPTGQYPFNHIIR